MATTTTFPLTRGTVTEFGTVETFSLTAYRMTDGSWVPFALIHQPEPVAPLVTFSGWW